jgi:hypothetical protein
MMTYRHVAMIPSSKREKGRQGSEWTFETLLERAFHLLLNPVLSSYSVPTYHPSNYLSLAIVIFAQPGIRKNIYFPSSFDYLQTLVTDPQTVND